MTTIDKFINAAGSTWGVRDRSGLGVVDLARPCAQPGDGYPQQVSIDYDPETREATGGSVLTSYDPNSTELEQYELGTRSLMGVIADVDNPFRFKTFHDAWLATHPVSTSEKILASRIGESERQIRNARITGSMSGYMADKLCVVVLGKHPIEMYGFEAWVEYESKGAWPVPSKRRKVVPEVKELPAAPVTAELPGGWR